MVASWVWARIETGFGRNFPVPGIFETSELSRTFLLISLKKTLCTKQKFRAPAALPISENVVRPGAEREPTDLP